MASSKQFPGLQGLKSTYRALYHRNFRLFFGGQSISQIGNWMQQIAVSWLTFSLTHSAFLLGVVGFTGRIPTFILAPFTGIFIDRWDRHRILIVTQILSMIQALVLAILVLTGSITIWYIIFLSFILGLINVLDQPTRHSFVVELVESKEDLSNAIALSTSMTMVACFVGPAIAGVIIAALGEGICLLVNGLSFVAVITSLLAIKIKAKKREKQSSSPMQNFKEGFSYTFGFPPIRTMLFLLALVSLMAILFFYSNLRVRQCNPL